ncbi:TlpA family protein disulfide reductase [Denitromonas iodatirespirans]|uniref:TlpA family protein disulfide reductase n=1 Tax=Denitromonas iodatirespirans TaxID=2795389 RepID=A0A944D9C9_DENI1|nr:TlpA disulfide reductase family protein [Denitromonas iodatirespirans]MBT0960302.1 TlpA family protein disulfide reductase [Denitromonas iodatirespirans]
MTTGFANRRGLVIAGVIAALTVAVIADLHGFRQVAVDADAPRASAQLPEIRFEDGDGAPRTLADFHGRVVLLNLWATWCVPCRKEMPSLDRLQATLGGPGFEVVALSIDNSTQAVRDFYREYGIGRLAIYIDPSTRVTDTLGAVGIPTTVLVDRDGRERWRRVGPAEWDAPEMVEQLREAVEAGTAGATNHDKS